MCNYVFFKVNILQIITFSPPYNDIGSGGSVVTLSRPVVAMTTTSEPALLGIVGADITMQSFNNFFKKICSLELDADENLTCILINQKGGLSCFVCILLNFYNKL